MSTPGGPGDPTPESDPVPEPDPGAQPDPGLAADPDPAPELDLASEVDPAPRATSGPHDAGAGSPDPAYDETSGATEVAGAERRRRHGAGDAGLRVPPWMLAIGAIVVVGLIVWLVVALAGGDDDESGSAAESVTTTTRAASPASLPQVLCNGPSYVVIDTGQSDQEMLDDVAGTEAVHVGSQLSTVPGGCIQGSTAVDDVVLALGPFDTVDQACGESRALQGVAHTVYAGSADDGLVETTCS